MKIAILHSALTESGGAERVVLAQAGELTRLGHQVTCYAAAVDKVRCFPDQISEFNIQTYLVNLRMNRFEYLASMLLVLNLAGFITHRLKGYDVLICHHEPAPWVGYQTFRRFSVPYLCYIHHPPRFIYPRKIEEEMGWGHNANMRVLSGLEKRFGFIKKRDLKAITHACGVLVNSLNIGNEIKKIYNVVPTLCYPGVELPVDIHAETGDLLTPLKINQPFILCTSRHTPHKRLDWLLEIFSRVIDSVPEVMLVMTGGFHPEYTQTLRKMADEKCSGRVTFLNYVSNEVLCQLYRRASVYAFTAPDEDFGLGPVEAMLYGTPVVCWDDGAGPSETVTDGVVGFKIKPYNLDEFTRKTIMILRDNDLRRHMGERAAAHARKNFSWENHARILNSMVDSLTRQDKNAGTDSGAVHRL